MHDFCALVSYFLALKHNKYTQNIVNINILKVFQQTLNNNKMKAKIIFFLFVCITLSPGCMRDRTKEQKEISNPSSIKGVIVEGAWNVHIFQDENAAAHIEYSAFLEDKIVAEVRGDGYLYLKVKNVIGVKRTDLTAIINTSVIELLEASGSSYITVSGAFRGQSCKVDLGGASKVKEFEYHGENVEVYLGGSSECSMMGEANSTRVSLSGSSDAYMLNFTTKTLDIKSGGASYTDISIKEKATGNLSGASTLKYRGDADVSEVKLSGSSKIKKTS
jgi:hypothetical protein